MHGKRRRRSEDGFTLVEVLVTMTITVIGLAGLLSLHLTTIKGNQIASRSAEAATFAQETIEELRAMPVDGDPKSIVAIYNSNAPLPIVNAVMPPKQGRANMVYNRALWVDELTTMSEDLVRIRVEVSWADDGANPATADERYLHSIALEIIRTRQEAL